MSFLASIWRIASQGTIALASLVNLAPDFTISAGTDSSFKTTTGGSFFGSAIRGLGEGMGVLATLGDAMANVTSTNASYARRRQDWNFQVEQAKAELVRMDRDIVTAEIRVGISERELANHDLSVQQTRAVDQYMREKFTNRELYDWMIGQLSTLYFQTYQIAFDLAKRAERAYRHELAVVGGAPIIKYGYWDSLRKGLLAGEKLSHDLERLDLAYMDRDVREFELRKSISLAELNPDRLNSLRETGKCEFDLPEALFDLDHPGHYLRRIRAIRITIPAVVGPHTTLGTRLQLLSHKTRFEKTNLEAYGEDPANGDTRFRYGSGAGQAIATSTAMSDGGLFNLDFKDERYLPFEYSGAISRWELSLPEVVRQFDYRTIEDVIIHVDYTAREGGDGLRDAAQTHLAAGLNAMLGGTELPLVIAVHEAFPNEWEQFFTVEGGDHILTLPVSVEYFPYFARRNGFDVAKVDLVLMLDPSLGAATLTSIASTLDLDEDPKNFVQSSGDAFMTATFVAPASQQPDTWTLTVADSVTTELQTSGDLDRAKVVGMFMIIRYTLT